MDKEKNKYKVGREVQLRTRREESPHAKESHPIFEIRSKKTSS
jgi:hypothetical protein